MATGTYDLGTGKTLRGIAQLITGDQYAVGVAQMSGADYSGYTAFTPITADGTLVSGVGKLADCFVRLGNSSRVILYDNTAASGTILFDTGTTGAAEVWMGTLPTENINFGTGVYADVTGTVTFSGGARL